MTMFGNASRGARTPNGLKVKAMGWDQIEEVAAELRPLLPTLARRGRDTGAIDCLRVLEHTLPKAGFNYMYVEKAELKDCAAFTIPERHIVVLREDVYDGLTKDAVFSRSTVVHELAHIVLNHAVTLHRGAELGKHKFYEDSEWQANALMAALLMPIEVCKRARSAHELAQMCGTSAKAAGFRIDGLVKRGLIEPKHERGLFDDLR